MCCHSLLGDEHAVCPVGMVEAAVHAGPGEAASVGGGVGGSEVPGGPCVPT